MSLSFLFSFFFLDSLGGLLFLQQKGGRTNTVSTHAVPTLHQPCFRRLSRKPANREAEIATRFGLGYSLNSPPEKTQIIYK